MLAAQPAKRRSVSDSDVIVACTAFYTASQLEGANTHVSGNSHRSAPLTCSACVSAHSYALHTAKDYVVFKS